MRRFGARAGRTRSASAAARSVAVSGGGIGRSQPRPPAAVTRAAVAAPPGRVQRSPSWGKESLAPVRLQGEAMRLSQLGHSLRRPGNGAGAPPRPPVPAGSPATLIQELLDAHDDTARLAAGLADDV